MIDVLTRETASRYSGCLESMFRLRHEIFIKRLGWRLDGTNGMEQDQFDREDAVYLVLRNDAGEVVASARLLPTTKPNLLFDVFPFLVEDFPLSASPMVWEVTRVAVDCRKERIRAVQGCSNVAGTLFCGIFELAVMAGLTHLVSVSDTRLERILRRRGWNFRRLGQVHRIDDIDVVGEISEVNRENLAVMRHTNGISGPVLAAPSVLPGPLQSIERRAA